MHSVAITYVITVQQAPLLFILFSRWSHKNVKTEKIMVIVTTERLQQIDTERKTSIFIGQKSHNFIHVVFPGQFVTTYKTPSDYLALILTDVHFFNFDLDLLIILQPYSLTRTNEHEVSFGNIQTCSPWANGLSFLIHSSFPFQRHSSQTQPK